MFVLGTVKCGGGILEMNIMIPQIIGLIVTLIKIGVPILLIVFGMLDLGKAVMAQKEDEIKKAQQTFIKRLIAAALVFFVVMIVQTVFNLVAGDDKKDIWNCINCFINGPTNDAEEATDGTDRVVDCRLKED